MPNKSSFGTPNFIEAKGIGKDFNGVWVLRDFDFDLKPGEIHSVVGENGAGKSTFIKILSGVYPPSSGDILVNGQAVDFRNVEDSEQAGIRTVHQEIHLVPYFSVYRNMFIGNEIANKKLGLKVMDDKAMADKAAAVIKELGIDLNVNTLARYLNASLQRIVEIGKVLVHDPQIIIFDEPTTSLGEEERRRLLEIITGLKKRGLGIIYISHNLGEVMEISDRITVLKDGVRVATMTREEASEEKIVSMMIGHRSYQAYKREKHFCQSEVCLEIKSLFTDKLNDINLKLRKGEILGVAAVVGGGKTEIARTLFGLDKIHRGRILIEGQEFVPSPGNAVEKGLALVPEERQAQGLIPNYSVQKNVTLTYLNKWCHRGVMDQAAELRTAQDFINLMSIKTTGPKQAAKFLSGGNQQKVVLSRWLSGNFEIGLFDEPTKGIDVKAKEDIYRLLDNLAREGKAAIVFSSYLPELLCISDRILVLHRGSIVGEFSPEESDAEHQIMQAMLGGRAAS